MTDESQPQPYGPPPGSGPTPGQPPPPQHASPYAPPSAPPSGGQPPSGPSYGPQPPAGPPYGQQPPTGPPYGQPPTGPPYGQQPPSGPPQGQQPPSGPSYGFQPPSGPAGYGPQPPSGASYGGPAFGGQPYPTQGPYGGVPQFGPRPDPKLVRPPLWWIAVAWVIALVCVLAGVGLFGAGVFSTVSSVAPSRTFASGESVTVPLDPADKPAIYLASATRVHYVCQISGGPGQARLANTRVEQTVTQGSTRWQLILLVNAPARGDYRLVCETQEQAGARFGVGRDLSSAVGGLAGGVAALLLIPGAGILVGIVVTVVVLVRRSGSRKRLAMGG
ncbi:hypothetical protein [Nonomuraea lactucae]|uniref:hypothetical protein n=1 Tax=Nonomuraea lactucae TaxID=2249762 RepID=UPI001F06188C|nr:hypothetical protein [Nonomuraea lactucae]